MTKRIWTGAFTALVGFAAATAISAQTTTPPQTTTPSPTTTASSDQKVTVTGCLKEAPANAAEPSAATTTAGTRGSTAGAPPTNTGAPSAASEAATAQKFMLTEASKSAGEASAPTPTGTSGSTPPAATDTAKPSSGSEIYRLIANPAALSQHVGKKLELTGTLVDSPDSSAAASNSSGKALRVESGKVIAASCTP